MATAKPNESAFKSYMVARLKHVEGGYGRRIEDQFAVGLPDMIMIPKGLGAVFMIEAKIVRSGAAWEPRPRQMEELKQIAATGAAIPAMMALNWTDDTVHVDFPAPKLQLPGILWQPRLRINISDMLKSYMRRYNEENPLG